MERTWQLPRTSKKLPCPGCGKRSFKPYVYSDSGDPIDDGKFGRCDHENNCAYDVKPENKDLDPAHKKVKQAYVIEIIYPKEDLLKDLFRTPSNLHRALAKKGIPEEFLYDEEVLTTKSGLTAFVIRDISGKFCNIKYFKYKEDGHRDKEFQSYSLKQPEQRNQYIREQYAMPIYGEHQFDPDKKKIACIVESEKSRVIAKFYYPEFDWGGCGSANGLSDGTDGSTDKITPLKGRITYWVCDNDPAARGKFKEDDRGKSIWVDCSSVRNGKKHIPGFHIADLFTDKAQGYDIGDALLDGLKPEIKPTWSRANEDPRYKSYIPPNDYRIHEELASQIGETSCISAEFDNTFSWMRTQINAFYGWSNDGKGTMLDFLSVRKSMLNGWKRCAFKEEDMGAYSNNGNPKITADRIYAKLAWTLTGEVPPPFRVYAEKHKLPIMSNDKYAESMEWVKKHNFIVYPQDRRYKSVFDEFLFFHEVFGCDVYEIDPWITIILEQMDRGDERLIQAFLAAKEFVLKTNTVLNIVNHPGSRHEVKEKSGAFKVVNQFMQLGGSAWDIKMDGQFSIHRPFRHKEANDPRVHFWNLKQRDSEIVGAERGVYKKIQFDKHKRQYYFDGVNPIDGTTITPIPEPTKSQDSQGNIQYTPSWHKSKKGKSFEQHLSQDWQAPRESDEPPFG